MNRRNFIKTIGKICAALPFVGSSSVTGASGTSEGQRRPGTRPATREEIGGFAEYLRLNFYYWGNDSNNTESYFHFIDGKYTMIPIKQKKSIYV